MGHDQATVESHERQMLIPPARKVSNSGLVDYLHKQIVKDKFQLIRQTTQNFQRRISIRNDLRAHKLLRSERSSTSSLSDIDQTRPNRQAFEILDDPHKKSMTLEKYAFGRKFSLVNDLRERPSFFSHHQKDWNIKEEEIVSSVDNPDYEKIHINVSKLQDDEVDDELLKKSLPYRIVEENKNIRKLKEKK